MSREPRHFSDLLIILSFACCQAKLSHCAHHHEADHSAPCWISVSLTSQRKGETHTEPSLQPGLGDLQRSHLQACSFLFSLHQESVDVFPVPESVLLRCSRYGCCLSKLEYSVLLHF